MDHYEHRSWPAWHRHMIYVFLGLHFMLRLRIQFKKNSSPHVTSSPETHCGNFFTEFSDFERSHRNYQIPHSS
jgi:hypothetical protein